MVESAGEAHVDHIEGDGENGEEEDFAQQRHIHPFEQACAGERTEEHTDHDGEGNARHDVAALNVDHGRGTGGDADHEVGRGGAHFEGHFHARVHR